MKNEIRIAFRDGNGARQVVGFENYAEAYKYVSHMAERCWSMKNSDECEILGVADGENTLFSSLSPEKSILMTKKRLRWEELAWLFGES